MFFRVVAYLRVHPRIAVLYKTIEVALDDLFHFFIVFGLLFAVLAFYDSFALLYIKNFFRALLSWTVHTFIGVWMFGAINGKFASFTDSFITQFEMLMGEYPWPLSWGDADGRVPSTPLTPESPLDQNYTLFHTYLQIYSLVVFFILLNFLLAIIVDSYASVKEMVNVSVVECNILTDMLALILYPILRLVKKWPDRGHLIRKLLALDVNFDFINDEEEAEDSVVITETALVRGKIKGSCCTNYYPFAPGHWHSSGGGGRTLDANKEEDGGALEHQHKLHALRNLDILRERLLEAAVSSGLVTLPKPATTKVPLGAQLEEVKSAFVEKLDEIYGATR
eukprot:g13045.t1